MAFVFFLDAFQTVLSTYDGFRMFGTSYGDLDQLNSIGLLWFSVPFLNVIGTLSLWVIHGTL